MKRRGWTLHEMLISLVVMGGVTALAVRLAVGQMRFFRTSADRATSRGDATQATAIAAAILRSLSPKGGDIQVALDSAIEVQATTGTAIVCSSSEGLVTVTGSAGTTGNTLASFTETPEAGDRVSALHPDSLDDWWSTHVIADASPIDGSCAGLPAFTAVRSIRLRDSTALPTGSALRFTRPFRLSLYRGGDGRWYLGARDWNGEAGRFNTIQPVAGPLGRYDPDPTRSGFMLLYWDSTGAELAPGADRARIATIVIAARATSGGVTDSNAVWVALRNAR